MKDFELNIGQGRLLLIRKYGVAGVAELRILGREENGEREEIFDTPLKEEDALHTALALVEAADLFPDFGLSGSPTSDWMKSYETKGREWDKPLPSVNTLINLSYYRKHLDHHEAKLQAHNEKILSDARVIYNKQRSASDWVWEDLIQKSQVKWIEIALLAEKLNTPKEGE